MEFPKSTRRPDEVFIGWGHHDVNPAGEVYTSSDPGVVKLFQEYFLALAEKSTPKQVGEVKKKDSGSRPVT